MVLKSEPPTVTRKLFVISRIRDAETRAQLEMNDDWDQAIAFDDEKKAKQELAWMSGHGNMREYMLIGKLVPSYDDLDDDIPF